MEELTAIKTADGREFKPWASREDVQAIGQETVQVVVQAVEQAVQDPASITAITSEIASGKQAIASAINAKGGTASATESFAELAEAVEEIPNYSDMVKLAGIIAGGNYNKNALQGHNENFKYGKTEIVDNVGAFEHLSIDFCFLYWDMLERVVMPSLLDVSRSYVFSRCSAMRVFRFDNLTSVTGSESFSYTTASIFYAPKLSNISGNGLLNNSNQLKYITLGTLTTLQSHWLDGLKIHLRNITIGNDTNINLPLHQWTATDVIAEGQSGIDELNSNLYNNLLTKLYDHSGDGETRTLHIGWLANVTAENIAYANAKGWTLTN